jgi:hypothetical protein
MADRILNAITDQSRTFAGLESLLNQVDWTFRDIEDEAAAEAAKTKYLDAVEYALQMRSGWRDDVTHLHNKVQVSKLLELWNGIASGPGNKLNRAEWV